MPLFEPGTRFWHLDEMLKYKLYPRNDNWESKCDFFFSLLSVDCKSKIVLASCFPSKEVFWQKEMLFCHIRENTIQYWSVWEGWRESRDCGDHVIWSFWSVITQVMTLHRGVCVCVFTWFWYVWAHLEIQQQSTTASFCTNGQSFKS